MLSCLINEKIFVLPCTYRFFDAGEYNIKIQTTMYFGSENGNETARCVLIVFNMSVQQMSKGRRRQACIRYKIQYSCLSFIGDDASAEKRSKQMAKCAASTSGQFN